MNVHETRFRDAAVNQTGEQFILDHSSFPERTTTVAKAAAAEAEEVDRNARFPQAALDAMRQQRLLGVQIPPSIRRRRRVDPGGHRDVLYARARLFLHRDDLRDASDQGRLPGPARRRLGLA